MHKGRTDVMTSRNLSSARIKDHKGARVSRLQGVPCHTDKSPPSLLRKKVDPSFGTSESRTSASLSDLVFSLGDHRLLYQQISLLLVFILQSTRG